VDPGLHALLLDFDSSDNLTFARLTEPLLHWDTKRKLDIVSPNEKEDNNGRRWLWHYSNSLFKEKSL